MRRTLCRRLQLPSLVTDEALSQAKASLQISQLHLHRLELSQRILSFQQQTKKGEDKNTIYKLLLPHIHLQAVSIHSLRRDLLSETISKQFLFQHPHEDAQSVVLKFDWACERHNNPHMDINSFQSELSRHTTTEGEGGVEATQLFTIDETALTVSAEAIDAHLNWFIKFASSCLRTTTEGQQCRYQATHRDMAWFLSFLLTHPSDTAFDAVSALLMKDNLSIRN
jgi:hypothetical protein